MNLELYIFWGCQIFILGFIGSLSVKNNIIFILIAVEIMLLAVGVILAVSSYAFDDGVGQLFVLIILTIAAAESTIGLALIIKVYKLKDKILSDIPSVF